MSDDIRKIQNKILEIIKFVDEICKKNNIIYYIMGGTALGAVRHKGFIPWDDDLDIFMTPENYNKFKEVFYNQKQNKFYLQEWRIVEDYLEYSKIRMNGTTLIESQFKNNKEIHQGIYIDIFILHKCPNNKFIQKKLFYYSKFVMIVALSQRNWKPKNLIQSIVLKVLKLLPKNLISNHIYKIIYKYDSLKENYKYCFFIDKAKFESALFEREWYDSYKEYKFEDIYLYGPSEIKKYLEKVYGNYMILPTEEQRKKDVHAEIWDTEKDYTNYIN